MTTIEWTHPSVHRLLETAREDDPIAAIERRAREIVVDAIEEGWDGPPYDPFRLADILGIDVVARQDLDDARLISQTTSPRIEFNPARRPARVRFSIAHEIGHFLFPDYGDRPRYRDASERRGDDWQLEILCNIAAAEFLMPLGAFPIGESKDLSLPHLLDLRSRFGVSTEALLRRAVRLTDEPSGLFAATRLSDALGFRIDYVVPSRNWTPPVQSGDRIDATSVLSRCTAVGFSDDSTEMWDHEEVRVQAVGVPPYPGHSFPRLVGLLRPTEGVAAPPTSLRYVRGDASHPRTEGPAVIAHIVNDRARSWGGRGFARSLIDHFPEARDAYAEWTTGGNLRRGAIHLTRIGEELWIASLVAQAGYGDVPTRRPRLRFGALRESLRALATFAIEHGADVHMPPIGTGQGGARWPQVRDLILEELVDRGVSTTVYVLPEAAMPEDASVDDQLSLL